MTARFARPAASVSCGKYGARRQTEGPDVTAIAFSPTHDSLVSGNSRK